jgi:hypothetical protein
LSIYLLFEFSTECTKNCFWQIAEVSTVTFEDFSVRLENYFLNKLLSNVQYYIKSVARSCFEGAAIELKSLIAFVNKKLQNNEYFEISKDVKLRPREPITSDSDLLTLMFDIQVPGIDNIKDFPTRFENAHSQQFWMHQSSLLEMIKPHIPYNITTTSSDMCQGRELTL